MRRLPLTRLALTALLAGCVAAPHAPPPTTLEAVEVLLLGEQHDAPLHQQRHLETLQALAGQNRLAALALEMAEVGASTQGLSPQDDEAAVRAALRWDEKAWPWPTYAPAVMAAVRAGIPVLGANLPRAQMRAAMGQAQLDVALPPAALIAQQAAIREGHCGLLPETQIAPMTRIQIARDQAMARTVAAAAVPGRTVLLLAGAGHVDEALGVPQHLPPSLRSRSLRWPAQPPQKDYCAELRESMAPHRP